VPCQPTSVAGKRGGKKDDRWLWPEALRVIRAIQPTWVVLENVSGLVTLNGGVDFDDILTQLELEGYEVHAFLIPAAAVGANHRRERVFIVGYSERSRREGAYRIQESALPTKPSEDVADPSRLGCGARWPESEGQQRAAGASNGGEIVADTHDQRFKECDASAKPKEQKFDSGRFAPRGGDGFPQSCLGRVANEFSPGLDGDWWRVEPDIPRVVPPFTHAERVKIPAQRRNRVDRLKCLGNAVVPAQVYPILQAIADIEA
jgi:DNA (cytosine-5)-methyltransferase 1